MENAYRELLELEKTCFLARTSSSAAWDVRDAAIAQIEQVRMSIHSACLPFHRDISNQNLWDHLRAGTIPSFLAYYAAIASWCQKLNRMHFQFFEEESKLLRQNISTLGEQCTTKIRDYLGVSLEFNL